MLTPDPDPRRASSGRWSLFFYQVDRIRGRETMRAWLERRRGTLNDLVFPSRNDYIGHMSTRQYARLAHEWVAGVSLPAQEYGTRSLRRTKAAIIYKATGNLRAVQLLLSHAKIGSTVRCLGVDVEDALELAERTEV